MTAQQETEMQLAALVDPAKKILADVLLELKIRVSNSNKCHQRIAELCNYYWHRSIFAYTDSSLTFSHFLQKQQFH